MEKILANTSAHKRLAKIRNRISWINSELETLPELYEKKKQRRLSKLINSYNKKLEGPAFKACDKGEYFDVIIEEKLKAFDKKQYMRLRAVNHAFAKRAFACERSKNEGEFAIAVKKHEQELERLYAKRAEFVKRLETQKTTFIAQNPTSDVSEYTALRQSVEAEYKAKEQELVSSLSTQERASVERLTAKRQRLEAQAEALVTGVKSNNLLPEGVLLSVKNLKMYFGGLKAVDDLTFDVKKGEIFGLIGPNGAGKTTVFNCITRFYDATGGDMYFENKQGEVVDLRAFKVHDVILQGITRTFQNVELVKEVSVLDNLLIACTREFRSNLFAQALGLPMVKKEEKLLKVKAMKILKFMELESYASWYAMGLPYGILKKVEIARALMAGARLIIMDEPAAGLNDSETAELAETIKRIRDEFGVTILLVEHDMSLVMNVCDTVCAISFGKMLAIGTCEEIKKNKAVQEAYLGVEEDE